MEEFHFTDALTGHAVALAADGSQVRLSEGEDRPAARAIFFPGCSLLNYAPALVAVLADYLADIGVADGVSLLCCGKILDFEEDGARRREVVDGRMREAVAASGAQRIVAACPNCAAALRQALGEGPEAVAEVVALPTALAEAGCAVDDGAAARVLAAKGAAPEGDLRLWVHDSCPDAGGFEFGRGVRALVGERALAEGNRAPASRCCGSTARAAGRYDAALSQGARRAEVAASFGACALVTACMSCAASLAQAQQIMPVVHYLELLCDYPLDWRALARPMDVRLLLEDDAAVAGGRAFVRVGRAGGEA